MPGHTLAPQTNIRGIVGEIGRALDWLAEGGALVRAAIGLVEK